MQPSQYRPDENMVVATPELVAFSYELAGIGSRFIAALLDLLVALAIVFVLGIVAFEIGATTGNVLAAELLGVVGSFVLVYGYFWAQEAAFNGQTLGKRATRLRVVGENGEPITFSQAGIRNLIRFVDFLPLWYGIGLVTLFINARGRRLGDLAAGTVVVRERQRVRLQDLPTQVIQTEAVAPSTWSLATDDPAARQFLATYASRRGYLNPLTRRRLALTVEPLLRRWAPDVLARYGPEAALDSVAFSSAPPSGPPAPPAAPPPPPPPPPPSLQ